MKVWILTALCTWGQFFVYQGFNDRVGWMHTSSNVDAVDEYVENRQQRRNGHYFAPAMARRTKADSRAGRC